MRGLLIVSTALVSFACFISGSNAADKSYRGERRLAVSGITKKRPVEPLPADALRPENRKPPVVAVSAPTKPVPMKPVPAKPEMRPAPKVVEAPNESPKTVHVKGYFRKNGTYVEPHDRAAPKKKSK